MKTKSRAVSHLLMLFFCTIAIAGIYSQQYSLTVTGAYGFKYYGDHSGIVFTSGSYIIGPYNNPFIVIIEPLTTRRDITGCGGIDSNKGVYFNTYNLSSWTINGTTAASLEKNIIIVDNSQPESTTALTWRITLTGDGFFNLSNQGIIAWFCAPEYRAFIGETFSGRIKLYFLDIGPLPADLTADMDIHYNQYSIRITSITDSSGNEILPVLDTSVPGIIRVPDFYRAGIDNARFNWTVIDDADSKITISFHNSTDGSPIVINGNTLTGYTTKVTARKQICSFGDVDGNDNVNIVDALMIARYYVGSGPVSFEKVAADVNLDKKIDIIDALVIARYSVGLNSSLPVYEN